jgi:hypothetical protein
MIMSSRILGKEVTMSTHKTQELLNQFNELSDSRQDFLNCLMQEKLGQSFEESCKDHTGCSMQFGRLDLWLSPQLVCEMILRVIDEEGQY